MARETKQDLQDKLYRLEKENEALRAKVAKLESEPGVFASGSWRSSCRYVARPMPAGMDVWNLQETAAELLLKGDWETEEDKLHTELVMDVYDSLPPGISALIVEYTYSNDNGIYVSRVWPAVKIN